MNDGQLFLIQETQSLCHRRWWKNVSAGLAGADLLVVVELLIDSGDLAGDISLIHDATEYQFIAFLAEPRKLFSFFLAPLSLYDKAPGVIKPARRMRQVAGTNENLSLFDRDDLSPLPWRLQVQLHVAFDLIKELVTRLDVKIQASIRAAQNHHQKIFVMDDELVGFERRVEEVLIFIDPAL
jgi:hypothetical protein